MKVFLAWVNTIVFLRLNLLIDITCDNQRGLNVGEIKREPNACFIINP